MNTNQKLEHARCMANACRNYLNSAHADLEGDDIPQAVVYEIIGNVDRAQATLQALAHARGEVTP